MGEALFELEQILRSKQVTLTPQEANVLITCKSKAIKEFTVSACIGATLSWIATRRLNSFTRVNLSAGGAFISGMWRFAGSFDSCIDHILSMDGTRMQAELANIMVRKYRDDPSKLRYISKHFYSEEVFDDSTSERLLRWRRRNFYFDNASHGQATTESNSLNNSGSKQTDVEPKKDSAVNLGINTMADPLDCIFGYSTRGEEICRPDISSAKPRVLSRSNRKYHRRRRTHRQEASVKLQHA